MRGSQFTGRLYANLQIRTVDFKERHLIYSTINATMIDVRMTGENLAKSDARISDLQYCFARYQETKSVILDFRFLSQMRTCLLSFAFIYLYLHCRSRNNIICGVATYKKYTHKKWNIESSDIRTSDICKTIVHYSSIHRELVFIYKSKSKEIIYIF